MIIKLILIAIWPAVLLLFYVNHRDKYDKEPKWLLILSVLAGAFSVLPIIFIERLLFLPASWMVGYAHAGWNAFVVAAFTEELFKFLFVLILIWRSKHFNEQFDGIVYAVYVSMGFAMVENVMYVLGGGMSTALARAFTAVPAHAIFAVSMGYFLGRAKFNEKRRATFLLAAIGMPILLHGLYDFILMSEMPMFLLFFLVYMFVLYRYGLRSMRVLSDDSRFNPKGTRYYRNTDNPIKVEKPPINNSPSSDRSETPPTKPESEQTQQRGFDV